MGGVIIVYRHPHFGFRIYQTDDSLGGLDGFHDLLVQASERTLIQGIEHSSYLTFKSRSGVIFAISKIITRGPKLQC